MDRTLGCKPAPRPCRIPWTRALCATPALILCVISASTLPAEEPKKQTGPSHQVSLAEEEQVYALFEKASTLRARAQREPRAWAECVACYAQLLRDYGQTVYLERWEGPDGTDVAFQNGLYRSTLTRMVGELSTLPAEALEFYRSVADPPSLKEYQAAAVAGDERRMERLAWSHFGSAGGRAALFWLAETSYERGAYVLARKRYELVARYPGAALLRPGALVRLIQVHAKLGDRAAAEGLWKELNGLRREPNAGELRLGHREGVVAMDELWRVIESLPPASRPAPCMPGEEAQDAGQGAPGGCLVWPRRLKVGARKWSHPLVDLLYGPGCQLDNVALRMPLDAGGSFVTTYFSPRVTCRDGWFYLTSLWFGAAYPARKPEPGRIQRGGNGVFFEPPWPTGHASAFDAPAHWSEAELNLGGEQHPYTVTLGPENAYLMSSDRSREDTSVQRLKLSGKARPPSYLWAARRVQPGVSGNPGATVWALTPGAPAFQSLGPEDRAWLETIYWTGAPTLSGGVLYAVAGDRVEGKSFWIAAVQAADGRLLWRTPLFSASRHLLDGPVRPAQGLPPVVHEGTVYVLPNQGAVAAVDAVDGGLRWLRVYDRIAAKLVRTPLEIWRPNPPLFGAGRLLITPQDSDYLYALDPHTGGTLWRVPRQLAEDGDGEGGLQHLLGVVQGKVVVTGRKVHFLDPATGRPALEGLAPRSPILGRGLIAGDQLLLPTEQSLVRIQTRLVDGGFSAQIVGEEKWAGGGEPGDLCAGTGLLLVTGATQLSAYEAQPEH